MNDSQARVIEAIQLLIKCQQKAGDEKANVRFMPVINALEEGDFSSALERWKRIPGRIVIASNSSDDAELRAAYSIADEQLYSLINETQFGTSRRYTWCSERVGKDECVLSRTFSAKLDSIQ